MKIYVASSWRCKYQAEAVDRLRKMNHSVYDFKDSDGFHWTEVDPKWKDWPTNVQKYIDGLKSPEAERGFNRDMAHLLDCDACIMVMPCGCSAFMETGWAVGMDKPTAIWAPEIREPDLIVKMTNLITTDWADIADWVRLISGGRLSSGKL